MQDPLIGSQLGHFQIEELIAEGGMGLIYKARHAIIGKQAAIKVLSEKYSSDRNMIKRLHREARAVNRISHPNIIDIFDFGQTEDKREYFVMEYVPGASLAEIMGERGRLPWSFIEPVIAQTLDALAAIHDLGFIHRDIKPENILVVEPDHGRVWIKLLDFGITRSIGLGPDAERLTSAGSVMGTPEYVAPEQIRGRDVDGRADLYAMGVMLFEMVMGYRPFEGEEIINLLMAHLREPVPPMADIPEELGVPEVVPSVVQKAMAKDPQKRFATARQFAEALGITLSGGILSSGIHAPLSEEFREEVLKRMQSQAVPSTETASSPLSDESAMTSGRLPALSEETQQERPSRPGIVRTLMVLMPLLMILGSALAISLYLFHPDPDTRVTGTVPRTPDPGPAGPGGVRPTLARPIQLDLVALYDHVRRVLRQGIRETTPLTRVLCAKGLGELREEDHLALLASILRDDPEPAVQSAAAGAIAAQGDVQGAEVLREVRRRSGATASVWLDEALMKLGQEEGRKALLKTMGTGADPSSRLMAAMALGEAGDVEALEPLQGILTREGSTLNPQMVIALLGTLARLGHEASLSSLEKALDSEAPAARLAAAEALSRLGHERAIAVLRDIVRDKDERLALVAARVLAGVGDFSGLAALTRALSSKDVETRKLGASGLGYIVDQAALAPLAQLLEDADWGVKATAAESLARIISQMPSSRFRRSQDWLRTALASRDWSVRFTAASISSEMDPDLAVRLLGWALKDQDPRVRREAVASLEKLGSKEAVPLLAHALKDEDPQVRREAAGALGKVAGPSLSAALHEAVQDSSPEVGISAAGALAQKGDETYVPDLEKASGLKDPELRRMAIEALGRWPSEKAVPRLRAALKDASEKVRMAAALGLARHKQKSPEIVAQLGRARGEGGPLEHEALLALQGLGEDTSKDMTRLMTSKAEASRRTAMVLAEAAEPAASLPVLRQGSHDSSPQVRLAAAAGLSALAQREDKARPLLEVLAKDSDEAVRTRAAIGLARLAKARRAPDLGQVQPVKAAPLAPVAAAESQPQPPTAPVSRKPPPFLEDKKDQNQYKVLLSQAAVATSIGEYERALQHLTAAQKLSKGATILFEMAYVHHKMGIKLLRSDTVKAGKHLKLARDFYGRYIRKAPDGKQVPAARTAIQEVTQTLQKSR